MRPGLPVQGSYADDAPPALAFTKRQTPGAGSEGPPKYYSHLKLISFFFAYVLVGVGITSAPTSNVGCWMGSSMMGFPILVRPRNSSPVLLKLSMNLPSQGCEINDMLNMGGGPDFFCTFCIQLAGFT